MDLGGNRVTWLGHGTWLWETSEGKRILVDAWLDGNPSCPDELKDPGPLDGILMTMFEPGNPASERVVDYVRRHLPSNIVFPTVIPRTIATADAFAAGQPVVLRSPGDAASQAYINLATQLADRFI